MGSRIEVSDISIAYGSLKAVDHVSFTVEPGEFFGVLGPNGAGKTTALEIIEGLRTPDSGQVLIDGIDPQSRSRALQQKMGVQLQSSAFFERLTAREQLQTFAALYGVAPSRADDLLEQVGLTEKAGSQVEKLSGGQAQRLSIACALVHEPEVIFLDEPTAALDPQARRNLWDFLTGLNESGRTVVLTTHYMEEAEALCDRVAIMDDGAILRCDSPAALIRELDAPTNITVAPGVLTPEAALAIDGVDDLRTDHGNLTLVTRDPARVVARLAEREALTGVSISSASLEDVFLDVTGRTYRS